MRCILLLAAALIPISSAAKAEGVSFIYENFRRSSTGALEIVLKFKNDTSRDVSFVRAECAFLDAQDQAVTTDRVIAQNIPAGSYAFGKNYIMEPGTAEKADCRITAVDF